MNQIDEIYTAYPFYGARKVAKELSIRLGRPVNRKQVRRLMRLMGIEAVYQKPQLSRNDVLHPVYPYLLKGVLIDHPNQVWGTDITYIRLKQGFVYLVAYLDWFTRYVVSWALSTTLEGVWCKTI